MFVPCCVMLYGNNVEVMTSNFFSIVPEVKEQVGLKTKRVFFVMQVACYIVLQPRS